MQYTELLAPNTLVYWPAAQDVHAGAPATSEYAPVAHEVQEAAPEATSLYEPARQVVHTAEVPAPATAP